MKAVVMAGGEGSRLRPLTSQLPKPLAPVVGIPVIEHIIRLLRTHGIREVIVTLAYLGADIRNRLGDGSDLDMSIEYVVEDRPMGTAGSVKNAADLIDETFLVISGDALTDIDLSWAIREHQERQAQATLVLKRVPNPLEYGVVITEPDGSIRRFLEKPSWGEVFSDQANTGIYVIEPGVMDYIRSDRPIDWSQDVFPQMLRRREALYGIVADGYWCDIGTIQSYIQANWDALEGRVTCHISGQRHGNIWIGEGVELGDGVIIDGPAFIGDEVKLKAGAHINDHAVIDRYVVVDNNAKLSNTVVWPHSYIGEQCRLRQTLVCRNVTVKNGCLLQDNSVVGDGCVIGAGSRLSAGVKLWPHKDIEPGSIVNESVIWAGERRRGLFQSYGMGGLINVELTPEFCARLGAAFGATLPKGSAVAVARDHARSSRMIKRAIVSGIVSAGAMVVDVDELPVPVTQFATGESRCDAGIHVLVSPLDQRSADIRFFDQQGMQLDSRAERKLENLFFREDFRRAAFYEMGNIDHSEPIAAYRERLLRTINVEAVRSARFRLLVDYAFSQASLVLPEVLNELNVSVIPLNTGVSEGPFQQGVAEEVALISRTVRADLGCKLSPTGERLDLIDDEGVVLSPHELTALAASWRLMETPGLVVAPATTPQWVSTLIENAGGVFVATKRDPSSVLRSAMAVDVRFGSDGEGGFVWPEHLAAFDAMYSLVKLLELRALRDTTVAEARRGFRVAPYLTASEFCPWERKGQVMRVLLEQHHDGPISLVDGIKIFIDGGFVLVRPDPDEPAYHIVASVDDEVRGHQLIEQYAERVRLARGEIPAEDAEAAAPA